MKFKIFYEIYKNGKLVYKRKSKSLLGNFARYFYGVLVDANMGDVKTIAGTTITLRSAGDVNASAIVIVVGTGTTPVTPGDYVLTNQTELSTMFIEQEFETYGHLIVQGMRTATAAESWSEIGFIQTVFDTAGATYKVLLARDVLPSPITLAAGDLMLVAYRIVVAV